MMKFKILLFLYLLFLVLMAVVVPLGELNTTLSDTFVFELRLDYLVHALVFMPLVVLWKSGFPAHSLWVIVGVVPEHQMNIFFKGGQCAVPRTP